MCVGEFVEIWRERWVGEWVSVGEFVREGEESGCECEGEECVRELGPCEGCPRDPFARVFVGEFVRQVRVRELD